MSSGTPRLARHILLLTIMSCTLARHAVAADGPSRPDPPTPEAARKSFWSFQPVKRPDVPAVQDARWVRNPVDAFVLARLESKGLHPAPQSDKTALLRRATYDLTGLPPSPDEVALFLADNSPDAYEKVIDRLLDSPHYGEKWGRYWLDLVRYGESNSYERDNPKPNVWRYRDYVIRSFNADKPYDQFVKEQLAGDEMPRVNGSHDAIIATGFYRLGIWDDEPNDRLQARYDNLDDIVTTTGQVFMGLTIDCARCHNHKIDPILQTDYYRLLAFFQNIRPYSNGGPSDEVEIFNTPDDRAAYDLDVARKSREADTVAAQLADIENDFRKRYLGDKGGELREPDVEERYPQYKRLRHKLEALRHPPAHDRALCVTESGASAPQTFVCMRGNANVPGEIVQPGFPKVLADGDAKIPAPAPDAGTCGRRTVLANWITSDANPLFTRVMANRVFQYHFGRGIVRSPNNFGIQGDKPTHPELLDWLASSFKENGLHLKPLHRLIMTSNAYRMSTDASGPGEAVDPQNDLLWHFDLRRLTAEEVRDTILSIDGTLNLEMFGPSVYPDIPAAVKATQSMPGHNWETSTPEQASRRSVYVHVKRSLAVPILQAFDAAETDRSCPVRFVTVQPTQALGMLNGEFINKEAQTLADRLKREAGDDLTRQINVAFKLATSRPPTEVEIRRSLELIDQLQKKDGATLDQARKYFCLMVLNLNEFVYLN